MRLNGCRLVIKPTTACAGLASTENGKYVGAAARKTQDAARLAALTNCQKAKPATAWYGLAIAINSADA
jgi:hypothetical protein